MTATLAIPFLSIPLLAVGGLAGFTLRRLWPDGGTWAALGAGVIVGGGAGLLGWVPWLGAYRITAYALCLLVAVVVAVLVARRRLAAAGLGDGRTAIDLAAVAMATGLFGARLLFVQQNWAFFTQDASGQRRPWTQVFAEAADLDRGGMVWYGGALLAGAALLIWARVRRWSLIALADAVVPAVLIALGIGRVGCFLNGCCWGSVCSMPWAVTRIAPDGTHTLVHPVQLYETAATVMLGTVLAFVPRGRAGLVSAAAIGGYSIWRFIAETMRGDHHAGARLHAGNLDISVSQGISIALLVVAIGLAVWSCRAARAKAADAPPSRSG